MGGMKVKDKNASRKLPVPNSSALQALQEPVFIHSNLPTSKATEKKYSETSAVQMSAQSSFVNEKKEKLQQQRNHNYAIYPSMDWNTQVDTGNCSDGPVCRLLRVAM